MKLLLLAFIVIFCTHNAVAQEQDTLQNYEPPPLFEAPRLPPPKMPKKPRVDILPEVSKQVDEVKIPQIPNSQTTQDVNSPRVIKEVKPAIEPQQATSLPPPAAQNNAPPIPKTRPVIEQSSETITPEKIKPEIIKSKDDSDASQSLEPINLLKSEDKPMDKPMTPEGVVKGPKTMPSYKKKDVVSEQIFVADEKIDIKLNDAVSSEEGINEGAKLKEAPPYPIDKKQSVLMFKSGQTDILSDEVMSELRSLSQHMLQNKDQTLVILSYASTINGKNNADKRISLDRGLTIRNFLIANGIKPYRINLKSFGSNTSKQPSDFVEINLL